MSGTPSEAEVQAQFKAVVGALEAFRAHVDGTQAGAGGKWDTLLQALEGDYTPAELAQWVNTFRAQCSSLLSPSFAASALVPVLLEYAGVIDRAATGTQGFGTGKRTPAELFRVLYDWCVATGVYVTSRGITYDTSATAGGSNVGNPAISRLTVDENGFDLEACTVEKKIFRCMADQNSGTDPGAEVFEVIGTAASFDSVSRASFGSGTSGDVTLIMRNAGGSNRGGSLLTNSSFSIFDSTATPKFSGWTLASGAAGDITQDTTNYYRTHPGATVDGALKMTWGGTTIRVEQGLDALRVRKLDPDAPYIARVMVNKSIGSASGGTVTLRMGATEIDLDLASMSSGWNELALTLDQGLWFRQFNAADFTVEIEWASGSSGYLLVDDAIMCQLEFVDGTYWFLRQNAGSPVDCLVDDSFAFTDTGGAPSTAKLQWWLWVSGLGYLPNSGSALIAEP